MFARAVFNSRYSPDRHIVDILDGITLAESIRTAREQAGVTQDELARLSGVRQPNIAAYESSQIAAHIDELLAGEPPGDNPQ